MSWSRGRRIVLATGVLVAGLLLAAPRAVQACATCSCGDPTLTVMGVEQPFSGRKRVSTAFAMESASTGVSGVNEQRIDEMRLDTAISWAPRPWLLLSASLPVVQRDVSYVNLAHDTLLGTGDLELRGKATIYRDRRMAPHHIVAVQLGVQLPTGAVRTGMDGAALDLDVQAGTGAFTPLAGVSYAHFRGRWSLFASLVQYLSTEGTGGYRNGAALRTTVAAQYQPRLSYGFRLAVDTRAERARRHDGAALADSGGFIAFLSPGAIYSPMTDLVLDASVRVPVVDQLDGAQYSGPIFALGATYDF